MLFLSGGSFGVVDVTAGGAAKGVVGITFGGGLVVAITGAGLGERLGGESMLSKSF